MERELVEIFQVQLEVSVQLQITYVEARDVRALTFDDVDELVDSRVAAEEDIGVVNF